MGTARCACAHAGQASKRIPAERARTGNRSRSGSVHAADERPSSTDAALNAKDREKSGAGYLRRGNVIVATATR